MTKQRGWYPDPASRYEMRYWDGVAWTSTVLSNGQRSDDPLEDAAQAPDELLNTMRIADIVRGLRWPEGRYSNSEYALLVLTTLGIGWALWYVSAVALSYDDSASAWLGEVIGLVALLWIPVQVAVFIIAGMRRFHDLGTPATAMLLMLLPGINVITFLYLLLKPGVPPRTTRWG